jgi:putative ABC transport system permease protein
MPARRPLGDRVYGYLLAAFPRDVREQFGDAMLREFRDARRERAGQPFALTALWARAVADTLWHGALEHWTGHAAVSDTARRRPVAARSWSGGLGADVRLGVRRLRKAPGFTLIASLTLALGIGANSAIFSVVDGVLLKPLPFPAPDRLVGLFQVWEGKNDVFSPSNFLDVQKRTQLLEAAAGYNDHRFVLSNAGDPVSITGAEVTGGFFETLVIAPALGRTFSLGEHEPGHVHEVVLSRALWQQRFSADPAVLGRTITLDAEPYEVIGVMPAGFEWPLGAQFWTPAAYTETFTTTNRGAWFLGAIGRLRPGVSLAQARAEVAGLGRQLETEYPKFNAKVGMTVEPLLDTLVGDTRRALLVMLGAVGFVLLIACVNVANLVLARASAREDELAIRVALGAGRARLVRQLLVESLVLAGLGGLAGLGLAFGGTRLLVALSPGGIPRLSDVGVDAPVLAFTVAATLVTGLLFGLAPAWQISRGQSLADRLHERGRSGLSSRRSRRLRGALVIVETALAVVLLAGAVLLVRSFALLSRVDPGFVVGHALTFNVSLPDAQYDTDAKRGAFYDDARARLKAVPGVTGVGVVLAVPPTPMTFNLDFSVSGRPDPPPGETPSLEVRVADAEYFRTMGIALRRGRMFSAEDRPGSTPVALLTESAVRKFFPGEDPIGRHITLGWRRNNSRVGGDVVGVVADVKSFGLDQGAPPQIYVPLSQAPVESMAFVVRTTMVDDASLAAPARAAIAAVDPNLPLNRVETLADHVRRSVATQRFYMMLLVVFAAVALALAAVGIFGVLSYLVTQRTREIGIRVVLGAGRGSVVVFVIRQALTLAAVGVVLGLAGAIGLSRVLRTMLFELSPTDPTSFIVVAAGLFAVAAIAAWWPARRAVSVDPLKALRTE